MSNKELTEEREKIVKGLELTYERLVEFKKHKKTPIIISKGDEIIELDPEKVNPKTIYKYQ
ncbi:hypothetical protein [Polaribacter sp. Hel_I_88]|uniref:hypothetical protein n=1 Tax=Polaribacter sp. Hel_I_88 TaxID=1250006 RepID=UPI00047B355A|nr:hypothetical protein [Polaribacter sp. Hel_I_88]